VFVDNSDAQGPPIIVETNPTYHNLFGVVEKRPIVGGYRHRLYADQGGID
jgi:predicted ATP-dependent protease